MFIYAYYCTAKSIILSCSIGLVVILPSLRHATVELQKITSDLMVQQVIGSLKVKMKTENQVYLQMVREKVERSLESLPELHLKQVCKLNYMVICLKYSFDISALYLMI